MDVIVYMKRRTFLKNSILSLVIANLTLSTYAKDITPFVHKIALNNNPSFKNFSELWNLLTCTHTNTILHGGSILSFINNKIPQRVLLSVESDDITLLKKELYNLDIVAIPNFGLKKDCIEFIYRDTRFELKCIPFLKGKYLQTKYRFFRHDYLAYDLNKHVLLDFAPDSLRNINFTEIELLKTAEKNFDNFLLVHTLSALYSVPISKESLFPLEYLNKRVCPMEQSASTALKLIAVGDDIFKTERLINFKKIFTSLYVESAFNNWGLPIFKFNNNIDKVYNIARNTQLEQIFVASSLLLLLVFERSYEITIHELPLTNKELCMSKDYLNKFMLARTFHSEPKLISLFI